MARYQVVQGNPWYIPATLHQGDITTDPVDLTGATARMCSYGAAGLMTSIGSTYRRKDGGAGTSFYVKESGTGNTGWVAK